MGSVTKNVDTGLSKLSVKEERLEIQQLLIQARSQRVKNALLKTLDDIGNDEQIESQQFSHKLNVSDNREKHSSLNDVGGAHATNQVVSENNSNAHVESAAMSGRNQVAQIPYKQRTFYYCHLFNDCFMWSNVIRHSRADQGPLNIEDNFSSVGALSFTKSVSFHRTSKVTCMPDCATFARIQMENRPIDKKENSAHDIYHGYKAFRVTYYWRPRIQKMARQLLLIMNRIRKSNSDALYLAPEIVMQILSYNGTDMVLSSPSEEVINEWFSVFQQCILNVQSNPMRRMLAPLYR